ncbi:MAG: LytTR family DNA-binding domain-containing protein [Geminicoccales bacterium]
MLHEWRSSIVNKVSPKTLIIAVAACLLGIVLALVEAELPADTAFIEALPLWLTIACTAAFLLTTIGAAIDHLFESSSLSSLFATGIAGAVTIVLVTIPMALMCLPIDSLQPDTDGLFEMPSAGDPLSALLWGWIDQSLNLLPAIAGFWLFIKSLDLAFPVALNSAALRSGSPLPNNPPSEITVDRKDGPSVRKSSALERRFPEIAGQTLLAIEADEHYVRLHTDAGSKHVLYRFRDAIKDVEDLAGLRIHRSWWIAEDAMEDLEQTASGFGLKLKGGLIAPVSQTYRRDVQRVIAARLK